MIFLQIALVCILLIIFFQDYKDRMVYWFLYPLVGILAFVLQTDNTSFYTALINAIVNLFFVLFLIAVCYGYSRITLKKPFFKEVFGYGDLCFFIVLAFTFAMLSFFILFVFSLLFSLFLHLYLKQKQQEKSVPLAGYMSLFFAAVYLLVFFCESNYLYAY